MVGSKKHSLAKNKTNPSSSRSGKEDKDSVARESGEGLVGSRIRVWWPMDSKFYEGVVDSYVSAKKKHRVLYDDGDVENLNLKKENWELIEEKEAEASKDESADEISEATPELKSEARSGKILDASEEEIEKQKSGVKTLERSEDVEEESPKPKTEKNGRMGDIGGKIVAAASRMSGRFQSMQNGHGKETAKALKSSKEVSESKNRKQKRPLSSSGAVSQKSKKPKTSLKKMKSNYSDGNDDAFDEEANLKALKSKISSSSAEAVSEDGDDAEKDTSLNESKTLLMGSPRKEDGQEKETPKVFSNKTNDDDDDDDTSDDDSKLLVSFLKKSPEAVQALIKKLNGRKEKNAGEGSGNETEEKESS